MMLQIDNFTSFTIFATIPTFIVLIGLFYRFLRPLFPVYVCCWFCDYKTQVPYGNQNCWDCPDCEQYNGFSKDGDYNKPIPAQFDEDLNYPVGCREDRFLVRDEVLCSVCSEKQSAKLRQLAAFNCPDQSKFDEESTKFSRYLEEYYRLCYTCERKVEQQRKFDEESTKFSRYLEEYYRLCYTCERKVEQQVREQDDILWSRLSDSLRSRLCHLQTDKYFGCPMLDNNPHHLIILSLLLHTIEVLSSLWLIVRLIQIDSDQNTYMKVFIPGISDLHPYLFILDKYTWHLVICLILSGLFAKIVLTRDRICKADFINSVFLLLVLFSQSNLFPGFHAGSPLEAAIFVGCHVTSIICALTTRREESSDFTYQLRNHIKPDAVNSPPSIFSPTNQNSRHTSHAHSAVNQTVPTRSSTPKAGTRYKDTSTNRASSVEGFRQEAEPNVNYSYTVYKFESCNLGANDSSTRGRHSRPASVCSRQSTKSSYAEALSLQSIPEIKQRKTRSPLISPTRFTPKPDLNRQGSSFASHGIFSQSPKQDDQNRQKTENHNSYNSSNSSGFRPYNTRSFTPPVLTQFGATPFSLTSIYSDRHTDSHDRSDHSSDKQTSSLHRSESFKRLRDTNTDISDEVSDDDSVVSNSDGDEDTNDDDRESVSDFTSVSQWCRRSIATQTSVSTRNSTPVQRKVKQTTRSTANRHKLYPWIMAAIVLIMLPSVQLYMFKFS